MDQALVAEIGAGEAYGSGYLVAPRLVLTAAHVVAGLRPHEQAQVRFLSGAKVWRCRLVWPESGAGGETALDAALLEICDAEWEPPPGAGLTRWGRLTSSVPGIACEMAGFPWAQRRPDGTREVEQRVGTINPITGTLRGEHQIDVQGTVPQRPGPGSPWAGLSGAAVLCGPFVTAVITEDTRHHAHGRLTAVPVERLLADEGCRATLRRSSGSEPLLESVELDPLLTGPDTLPCPRTPAALLRADAEVVRFRGRDAELRRLMRWCDGAGARVRLLTGPGGQGKSRLARELAARLRAQGWVTGHVGDTADVQRAGLALAGLRAPTLLVVDYAETRPGQVSDLIVAARHHRSGVPLRLLLLARSAGEWWEELARSSRELHSVVRQAPVDVLGPLDDTADQRRLAFREAWEDLATRLRDLRPDRPGAAIPACPPPPPSLSSERYGSPLTLQMEALALLLEPGRAPHAVSAEEVILDHEAPYWANAATTYGVTLHVRIQRRAIAAACLCGAEDEEQARALLARVPGLADQTEDMRTRIASWLRDLYPPAYPAVAGSDTGGRVWGSLQPDRLAEYLVATMLGDTPGLLDALLAVASRAQAHQALTVLTRAAVRHAAASDLLRALVASRWDLLPVAAGVAVQSEQPQPLLAGLDQLAANLTAQSWHGQIDELLDLTDGLPQYSSLLNAPATKITQSVVDVLRALAAAHRSNRVWLATALDLLGTRLAYEGRKEEALRAAEEAIALLRRVPRRQRLSFGRGNYRQGLAAMYSNLSLHHEAVGRDRDALEAAQRSVDIRRKLAPRGSREYLYMATSLHNLAIHLGKAERHQEALRASQESTDLFRQIVADPFGILGAEDPEANLHDLAKSLYLCSLSLDRLQRPKEALDAAREAAEIQRRLAADNPDSWLPGLPGMLVSLAEQYNDASRHHEALPPAEEAVAIAREHAATDPEGFLHDLGCSLTQLAAALGGLSRPSEAVAVGREAVDVLRRTAEHDLGDVSDSLPTALTVMAEQLLQAGGEPIEVVAPLTEAMTLAERADDEQVRTRALEVLARAYRRTPAEVAAAWRDLSGNSLPDGVR
jgi:tetratricopeptide (TPR) repeat protein